LITEKIYAGKDEVLGEASKCLFCGFCEAVCPTLQHGIHRGYGPRGRVNLVLDVLQRGGATPEATASLFSCLLCGSCVVKCPLRIDIPGLMRKTRFLLVSGELEHPKTFSIGLRG